MTATLLKNDMRRDDLNKEVRQLGRDAAEGKDALPKLALHVVTAAADGVISMDKDQDGNDDAFHLFSLYAKEEGKKAIHERTNGGLKANVSKLRQLVMLGGMTTCDPKSVIERAITTRTAMIDAQEKVKGAYPAYVDVARTQIANSATDLTDDEIKGAIRKKVSDGPEVRTVLAKIEKVLNKLITGEGGLTDQSDEVIDAHSAIKARLATLAYKADLDSFKVQAAKLGVVLPAEEVRA